MTAPLSNSLTTLADAIREASELSAVAARTTVEQAVVAGDKLREAKLLCQHGEWLPFLARAAVPERQAQRLMRLAEARLDIRLMSDLGIAGSLKFIAVRSRATEALEQAKTLFAEDREDEAFVQWGVAIDIMTNDLLSLFPPHVIEELEARRKTGGASE